jgi:hypothetical protein
MTDSRTKITHIIINDHDQHISAASTADVILAMPEIAEAQARIAELEAALRVLFDDYKQLADCGDAGNWRLEDTPEGKQAMLALKPKP